MKNSLGQPVHPTEEGCQNFAAWFGKSKVVDKAGNPLLLFHGTANDFQSFDVARCGSEKYSDWGEGIYLTPSPSNADYYRGEAAKNTCPEAAALWERLEKMEKETTWSNGSPTYPDGYSETLKEWRKLRTKAENEAGVIMPLYASIQKPFIVEYQSIADPCVAKAAKEKGCDGIVVLTPSGNFDEVVVFDPRQIKSAIGNSGRFDPASPSLTDDTPSLDLLMNMAGDVSRSARIDLSPEASCPAP